MGGVGEAVWLSKIILMIVKFSLADHTQKKKKTFPFEK